jgi:hypothetical protein
LDPPHSAADHTLFGMALPHSGFIGSRQDVEDAAVVAAV